MKWLRIFLHSQLYSRQQKSLTDIAKYQCYSCSFFFLFLSLSLSLSHMNYWHTIVIWNRTYRVVKYRHTSNIFISNETTHIKKHESTCIWQNNDEKWLITFFSSAIAAFRRKKRSEWVSERGRMCWVTFFCYIDHRLIALRVTVLWEYDTLTQIYVA